MRLRRAFAIAAIALAALGGCGESDSGSDATPTTNAAPGTTAADGAGSSTVVLKGVKFSPESVSVKAGETVTWEWDDGTIPHDVSGEGFKSEVQESGTFEHTFSEAGVFEYKCTVHPTMTGSVEVTE